MEPTEEEHNHTHVRLADERGDVDRQQVRTVPAGDLLLHRTDEAHAIIQNDRTRWKTAKLEIADEIWEAADQELALVWLALQQALVRGEHVRIHDGVVLLRMEAGIMARIRLRSRDTHNEGVLADLLLPVSTQQAGYSERAVRLGTLTDQVLIQEAVTSGYGTSHTQLAFPLPHLVSLSGGGVRADISFIASPLFLNTPTTSTFAMQAAAGAKRIEDKHREDDDYDDEYGL